MTNLTNIPLDWYILYSNGEIYSSKNNIYLKQRANRAWYKQCKLCINGKIKMFDVHRLIAKAFIQNQENKATVNHKNWKKLDNSVENLEWMIYKENTRHAIDKLWLKIWSWDVSWSKNWKAKKTWQYTKDWLLLKIRDYAKEWANEIGKSHSLITACCRGERQTAWWYKWRYLS